MLILLLESKVLFTILLAILLGLLLTGTLPYIKKTNKPHKKAQSSQESDFDNQRMKYINSLRHWSNCPKCLKKDMEWLADTYESGQLEEYEGMYAVLHNQSLSDYKFDTMEELLEYKRMHKLYGGVMLRVGVPPKSIT